MVWWPHGHSSSQFGGLMATPAARGIGDVTSWVCCTSFRVALSSTPVRSYHQLSPPRERMNWSTTMLWLRLPREPPNLEHVPIRRQ